MTAPTPTSSEWRRRRHVLLFWCCSLTPTPPGRPLVRPPERLMAKKTWPITRSRAAIKHKNNQYNATRDFSIQRMALKISLGTNPADDTRCWRASRTELPVPIPSLDRIAWSSNGSNLAANKTISGEQFAHAPFLGSFILAQNWARWKSSRVR